MGTRKPKAAKPTAVLEYCGNCRFYKPEGESGVCRRFPAQVVTDGDGVFSIRPVMEPAEWCGEHQGPRQ